MFLSKPPCSCDASGAYDTCFEVIKNFAEDYRKIDFTVSYIASVNFNGSCYKDHDVKNLKNYLTGKFCSKGLLI